MAESETMTDEQIADAIRPQLTYRLQRWPGVRRRVSGSDERKGACSSTCSSDTK